MFTKIIWLHKLHLKELSYLVQQTCVLGHYSQAEVTKSLSSWPWTVCLYKAIFHTKFIPKQCIVLYVHFSASTDVLAQCTLLYRKHHNCSTACLLHIISASTKYTLLRVCPSLFRQAVSPALPWTTLGVQILLLVFGAIKGWGCGLWQRSNSQLRGVKMCKGLHQNIYA